MFDLAILANIDSIERTLSLLSNPITDIAKLNGLSFVKYGIDIGRHYRLENMNDLSSIIKIGGVLLLNDNSTLLKIDGGVSIYNYDSLISIDRFTTVGT